MPNKIRFDLFLSKDMVFIVMKKKNVNVLFHFKKLLVLTYGNTVPVCHSAWWTSKAYPSCQDTIVDVCDKKSVKAQIRLFEFSCQQKLFNSFLYILIS